MLYDGVQFIFLVLNPPLNLIYSITSCFWEIVSFIFEDLLCLLTKMYTKHQISKTWWDRSFLIWDWDSAPQNQLIIVTKSKIRRTSVYVPWKWSKTLYFIRVHGYKNEASRNKICLQIWIQHPHYPKLIN